ncbi:MAG: anaerobic ribonucleoside-triphosphate reductase activating protein [Kiritimatiellae bacterium]|nr:anaerobic ribonucleoside-triphosphate reductase activating protein [Kiritimatiellia bacterium]
MITSRLTSPVYALRKAPTMIDYPGHLAGLLFTSGCNFRCDFCHNADLLGEQKAGMPWARLESRCREWQDHWVDAVVISGGEPTLCDDLSELIAFLKGFGFLIKLDTNGSCPEVLERCMPMIDYVAMDVKAGLSRYAEVTGFADTDCIERSMALVQQHARDYEFRTTVVPSIHSEADMNEIGDMIAGSRRYVMQPFLPRENLPGSELISLDRPGPGHLHKLADLVRHAADEVHVRDKHGVG